MMQMMQGFLRPPAAPPAADGDIPMEYFPRAKSPGALAAARLAGAAVPKRAAPAALEAPAAPARIPELPVIAPPEPSAEPAEAQGQTAPPAEESAAAPEENSAAFKMQQRIAAAREALKADRKEVHQPGYLLSLNNACGNYRARQSHSSMPPVIKIYDSCACIPKVPRASKKPAASPAATKNSKKQAVVKFIEILGLIFEAVTTASKVNVWVQSDVMRLNAWACTGCHDAHENYEDDEEGQQYCESHEEN